MAWVKAVCGRLESRYRYSNTIVYNNYPFPNNVPESTVNKVSECANDILKARTEEENLCIKNSTKATLASMYTAGAMPIQLLNAHRALDKAVDEAYGYKGGDDDASRVAFLFKRYEELTSFLPTTTVKKKRVKKTTDNDMFS
jgi:hypothetical protein